MEGQFFNPEQFEELLGLLQAVSTDQGARNERMRQAHNAAFQEFGPEVSAQVPDVAETAYPEVVGKALYAFLQTIPGVRTDATTLETVSDPNSVAMSDRAVSAYLRRAGKAEIGMSLTFASAMEKEPKHVLEFERVDPNGNRAAVSVQIGLDRVPKRGEITIGSKENGQFVTNRGRVVFGQDSTVLSGDSRLDMAMGEQVRIIPLLSAITNPEGLDQPFVSKDMVQVAKMPLLTE